MLKLKITAIVCFILFFSCTCFAANSVETEKDSGYYYATVDSDPGTGYSTAELTKSIAASGEDRKIYVSLRLAGSTATVVLEYKCPGDDDWTVKETYTEDMRLTLLTRGKASVLWRMTCTAFTGTKIRFGFDW